MNEFLVPTLRVGTHVCDALRRASYPTRDWRTARDAERPPVRSHAERGYESYNPGAPLRCNGYTISALVALLAAGCVSRYFFVVVSLALSSGL
jgi:hypothetical protein